MMLQERNYKKLLLAALLLGAASTASAWTDCGTNLQYEINGTELRFNSPAPEQPAVLATADFIGNTTITSFALPENVTTISTQAFNGCTALTHVDLGNVQTISTSAFQGCTALREIVIPPTVNKIMGYAFYGCTSLTDVLCRPYPAPTLGTDAFTDCAEGLKICVSSLGEYRYKDNWRTYYDNLKLKECFLDENDEQTTTTTKITMFRDYESRNEIDLFRTLRKAGCFNTLTLPFSVSLSGSPLDGDNVEVYEFAGATVVDGALQLDITPLVGNTLSAGTPYLIQWTNTGEVLNRMHFSDITWDADQTADDAGFGEVTYHGFYGKTHINDSTENGVNTGSGNEHFNLFLGGGNQLYWPNDGNDENAKMLGFRAWFRINGSSVSGAPVRRGMPAMLRIVATPTAINETAADPSSLEGGEGGRLVLRNGQLVIIRNGQAFSLNGQRL